jgi:hypothetical protein
MGMRFVGIGLPTFGPNDSGLEDVALAGGTPASRRSNDLTQASGTSRGRSLPTEELLGLKKGTPAAIGGTAADVEPDEEDPAPGVEPDDEEATPGVEPDPDDEAAAGFEPEPDADDGCKLADTALARSSRSIQSG